MIKIVCGLTKTVMVKLINEYNDAKSLPHKTLHNHEGESFICVSERATSRCRRAIRNSNERKLRSKEHTSCVRTYVYIQERAVRWWGVNDRISSLVPVSSSVLLLGRIACERADASSRLPLSIPFPPRETSLTRELLIPRDSARIRACLRHPFRDTLISPLPIFETSL